MRYVPLETYVIRRTLLVLVCCCCVIGAMAALQIEPVIVGFVAILLWALYRRLRDVVFPGRWAVIKQHFARQAREADEARFREAVTPHLPVLVRKRNMLMVMDDYGNWIADKWVKERKYFREKLQYCPQVKPYYLGMNFREYDSLIEDMIDEYEDSHDPDIVDVATLSPVEYEHYCAALLSEQGWNTRVTQGSGDQGVDVLAEKHGVVLALQCKKYASPVGNKAVQEIIAGRGYYQADFGVVVTNNTYTISARQLAGSQSIILLHHEQLAEIDALLGFDEPEVNRVW